MALAQSLITEERYHIDFGRHSLRDTRPLPSIFASDDESYHSDPLGPSRRQVAFAATVPALPSRRDV